MIASYLSSQIDNLCIHFIFAYIVSVSEMKRAIAREEAGRRLQDRFGATVVIAAAIIAAVHLARDENISGSSLRLVSVVSDSVALARHILKRVTGG